MTTTAPRTNWRAQYRAERIADRATRKQEFRMAGARLWARSMTLLRAVHAEIAPDLQTMSIARERIDRIGRQDEN